MTRSQASTYVCLATLVCFAAGTLWAQEAAQSTTSELVWVGVQVYAPDQESTEYLIGTIEKHVINAIEADTYERRFVRISNLRVEQTDAEGKTLGYWDATDNFDWGVILVDIEAILSIQFKKGDPMRIARTTAGM